MKIVINGPPIAKQRHRCGCRNRRPISYDPQVKEMKKVKFFLAKAIREKFNSLDKQTVLEASDLAHATSFEVRLTFHFKPAESLLGSQKNQKLWGLELHHSKPDLDNLEKFYLDCLSGLVWQDDAQVVVNKSKKIFTENPRVEIDIMAKKEIKLHPSAEAVLKIISPSELKEFIKDAREFWTFPLERIDELLPHGEEEHKEKKLTEVAHMLMHFAQKYTDKLRKINKLNEAV